MRSATLLTGDRREARDLVQDALVPVCCVLRVCDPTASRTSARCRPSRRTSGAPSSRSTSRATDGGGGGARSGTWPIAVGGRFGPSGSEIDPDARAAYTSGAQDGDLAVVDLDTLTGTAVIDLGDEWRHGLVAVDPETDVLLVDGDSGVAFVARP